VAHDPGIAVIRAHTAYQVPMHKTRRDIPPMNRPGIPPIIVTWADADSLRTFTEDVVSSRSSNDIVVASCHWGLGKETLAYMRDIGHAAIDAGADIVIGHGPHYSLAVEVYHGKPIFYGLGSFSFHTGHGGRAHGDWVGMMVRADVERGGVRSARFQFVRHNAANETVPCALADERAEFADIVKRSDEYGTRLEVVGDEVEVFLGR
jgi:poly-gamma-glutamate synthesis protein (capsule biosynthesis protein)